VAQESVESVQNEVITVDLRNVLRETLEWSGRPSAQLRRFGDTFG
jgi:hypothetical protein